MEAESFDTELREQCSGRRFNGPCYADARETNLDIRLKDNGGMTGIQYVTDEKGRKLAVQIDLKKHRELWEDIEDVLVSRARRHERRIPLEKVKADLVKSGKLPRG